MFISLYILYSYRPLYCFLPIDRISQIVRYRSSSAANVINALAFFTSVHKIPVVLFTIRLLPTPSSVERIKTRLAAIYPYVSDWTFFMKIKVSFI